MAVTRHAGSLFRGVTAVMRFWTYRWNALHCCPATAPCAGTNQRLEDDCGISTVAAPCALRFTLSLSYQLARAGIAPFLECPTIPKKINTTMFGDTFTLSEVGSALRESRDLITKDGPTLSCYECGHEGAHAMYSGTTTVVDEDGASTLPCDDGIFERRWTESECPSCGHCTRVRR